MRDNRPAYTHDSLRSLCVPPTGCTATHDPMIAAQLAHVLAGRRHKLIVKMIKA